MANVTHNVLDMAQKVSPYPPSFSDHPGLFFANIEGSGVVIACALIILASYMGQIIKDKSAQWDDAVTSFRAIIVTVCFMGLTAHIPYWLYLITYGWVTTATSTALLVSQRMASALLQFLWIWFSFLVLVSGLQIVYALKHPVVVAGFSIRGKQVLIKEILFFVVVITIFSALLTAAKYFAFMEAIH